MALASDRRRRAEQALIRDWIKQLPGTSGPIFANGFE
jgi:hypothetical protein